MRFFLRSICFLFLVSSFLNTFVSATKHLCHPDQRDALLEFKTEFLIPKPSYVSSHMKTESWVNKSDCCSWDGITCDAWFGKVIGLDLISSGLRGNLKSNSSLFRLRHLCDMNLAGNNFNGSPIPAEFDKLMGLERLNLSQSSLSGEIPSKLLQLTKLVSLDLSSNNFVGEIPSLVGNLKQLTDFNVGGNKLSGNLPATISNLTQIRSLYLYSNQFTCSLPPNISQLCWISLKKDLELSKRKYLLIGFGFGSPN